MGNNMQRLGDTFSDRMKRTAGAVVKVTAELGTISNNMSLITDSLSNPIPRGQYMVNLLLGSSYNTSYSSSHSHGLTLRNLSSGDRVLVVWCGYEPVVVAIVVSS